MQTRKRRGRSESAKDAPGEEAPPQLQPEASAGNGIATAPGVRPQPKQSGAWSQPEEAERKPLAQAGGDWNKAVEALAEEHPAWDSEPRPEVDDKWEAAAAEDEQDRLSRSAQVRLIHAQSPSAAANHAS